MAFRYSESAFIILLVFSSSVIFSLIRANKLEEKVILNFDPKMSSPKQQIYSCDFEVYGKVQGVFFRKHTEKQAKTLGVHGWCKNTDNGTVKGQIEAPLAALNEMKYWLQNKGSPKSIIQKAEFSVAKEIPTYNFKSFSIIR